ncbi:Rv2175c family DNA-binding protein [Microbacterium thalli]|uniref:Rv2175c family DNA-binding protein n=1 Tax=Microbacterium thalli TaxID=3027921 RepID=A0ABT5SHS7_9MICO|nr:Rv2175c family DNA-binding protein [Microbacterium thalli]MDD7962383.1 Rv2175c family DNA-binding protein [Microbacterium thalli]
MSDAENPVIPVSWLSLPEVVELTGESLSRVRRLLDENHLIGSRQDGVFRIPAAFFVDGAPLSSLRGTITVLHDAGFSDDETIEWLFAREESIGMAPIEALRAGRKTEVRRVAQTLA